MVLLVISIALLFYRTPSFSEKDVVLALEGPTQAKSGDEVVYTMKYANNTKITLKNLSFRFFFPPDSIVQKDDGTTSQDSSVGFTVDELGSGDSGEKQFKIFMVGNQGNIKDAKIDLLFTAGTLRSSFQKSATVSTTITGLPVPLTLVAPPSITSGQQITYLLDYRNETSADLSDLVLQFTYPDGFAYKSATPAPTTGTTTWALKTIKAGSGARISITGILTGNERESKNISVVLQRTVNGQRVDYEKAVASTVISSPLLHLSMTVNGSNNYTSHTGDTLKYVVAYKNMSNQTLQGLTLMVKLEGDLYDTQTMSVANGGFFDSGSNTVIWNSGAVSDFGFLSPNRSGTVQFNIRLKPSLSGALGTRNFSIKATATLATPNVPSGIDADEISTQMALITKVSTEPSLKNILYYNDPATGSSGPFPPQVGQETVLTVHWQIVNPGNDVTNAKIVGVLPTGVVWKNIVSATTNLPQPTFNKNTSEVIWNLGTLPGSTGLNGSQYEASFQISITPSSTQRNTAPTLLKNTIITGADAFTKQSISVSAQDLTTNDTVDQPNSGTVQ